MQGGVGMCTEQRLAPCLPQRGLQPPNSNRGACGAHSWHTGSTELGESWANYKHL